MSYHSHAMLQRRVESLDLITIFGMKEEMRRAIDREIEKEKWRESNIIL